MSLGEWVMADRGAYLRIEHCEPVVAFVRLDNSEMTRRIRWTSIYLDAERREIRGNDLYVNNPEPGTYVAVRIYSRVGELLAQCQAFPEVFDDDLFCPSPVIHLESGWSPT